MKETKKDLTRIETFEYLQDLLRQVIVARPEQPLDFLIEKINEMTPIRKLFLMGMPGTARRETAITIAEF